MSLALHRHGNAWLGDLIEHISDSTVLNTAQGMITYANPSAQRNTGYSAAELQGMHSLDLVHPEDLADCRRQMEKLLSKPDEQAPVIQPNSSGSLQMSTPKSSLRVMCNGAPTPILAPGTHYIEFARTRSQR